MRFPILLICAITFCIACKNELKDSSSDEDTTSNTPPSRGAIDLDTVRSAAFNGLDSIYQSAMHVDSSRAYFKGEAAQGVWFEQWQKMLYALSDYFNKNGLTWNDKLRIYSRVYFSEQGGIDHYLYSIKQTAPGYPGPAMRDSMRTLLTSFAKTYRMDSAIGGKVSQCGPVVIMPAE